MDWKAEALARVRRTRHDATQLYHRVDSVAYSLHSLGGYDDEALSMTAANKSINRIIKDLFELEGKLSRTK